VERPRLALHPDGPTFRRGRSPNSSMPHFLLQVPVRLALSAALSIGMLVFAAMIFGEVMEREERKYNP